jgi:tetratricopeptide (TPR) repeat protein
MSQLYWDLWEHEKGYYYLDKAITYNTELNSLKAWYYVQQGRYSDAVTLIENTGNLAALGFFHLLLEDYEKALQYWEAWELKVVAEGVQGIEELESWHRYGQVLAGLGREEEAKAMMQKQLDLNEKLLVNYQRAHLVYYESAGIHSFLGDKQHAIVYLRKFDSINRWDDGKLHFIQRDPLFDNIREDVEFKEIVTRRLEENKRIREEIAMLQAAGEL